MKDIVVRLVFFVFIFYLSGVSFANEVWEPVVGIKEADIKEVFVDPYRDGIIYVSSSRRLYRTEDYGDTWRVVFSARGDANIINFINVLEQGVFVCTKRGIFKSLDGKSRWTRVFKGVGTEESSVLHIAFSKDNKIYLGTRRGLFISNDNGLTWDKDAGEAGNVSIRWIAFLEGDIFLAAEKGVYKSTDSGWERVFVTLTEEAGYDSEETDEAISAIRPVNSILIRGSSIFLATDDGIFIGEDKEYKWKRFVLEGLFSQKVNRLLFKDRLYAATDKGIFVFSDGTWKSLYKGMAADKARSVAVDSKGIIWVATNKGLYRSNPLTLTLSPKGRGNQEEILELFSHEPDIREVQKVAIEYAEVHPDKIKDWRESARKKALLPDVSIGLDRYVTDLYHWDAGQNPDALQRGRDVITWDVTMSWDLGDFIWSTDQTSIDTRSRLMVQLRDDILDEITRTYFERRRLQIEMYLSPPLDLRQKMENDLRIQELTADLDALTGGYFSEQRH